MGGGDGAADRRDVSSLDDRGDEEADFIDKPSFEGFTECLAAPLDQDAGDAPLCEFLQDFSESHSRENQRAVAMSVGQELRFRGDFTTARPDNAPGLGMSLW